MGWAKKNIAAGRSIRGTVLAPDFDLKLKYAIKVILVHHFTDDQVRFEIHPEEASD